MGLVLGLKVPIEQLILISDDDRADSHFRLHSIIIKKPAEFAHSHLCSILQSLDRINKGTVLLWPRIGKMAIHGDFHGVESIAARLDHDTALKMDLYALHMKYNFYHWI